MNTVTLNGGRAPCPPANDSRFNGRARRKAIELTYRTHGGQAGLVVAIACDQSAAIHNLHTALGGELFHVKARTL